jgi:uncharacterized C2H2 Zn-finger protein
MTTLKCPWCGKQFTVNKTMVRFQNHLMKYTKRQLATVLGGMIARAKPKDEELEI